MTYRLQLVQNSAATGFSVKETWSCKSSSPCFALAAYWSKKWLQTMHVAFQFIHRQITHLHLDSSPHILVGVETVPGPINVLKSFQRNLNTASFGERSFFCAPDLEFITVRYPPQTIHCFFQVSPEHVFHRYYSWFSLLLSFRLYVLFSEWKNWFVCKWWTMNMIRYLMFSF